MSFAGVPLPLGINQRERDEEMVSKRRFLLILLIFVLE